MFRAIILILVSFCMCIVACRNDDHVERSNYKYYKPVYDGVGLVVSADTLHFPLIKTDNTVASISLFSEHGIEYVALYNEPSETVRVYEMNSQKLVKTISLSGYLLHKRHSTSVYCRNFDSIFISNNKTSLFIADSSGANKRTVYFSGESQSTPSDFMYYRPPVLKDSCFYESFPATDLIHSISNKRDWRLMCRFDLQSNKKERIYSLPERYLENFYSYHFLNYSYCFNNRRNFVFSFPADSILYETDFAGVNRTFYGRSQFQQGDIEPGNKKKKGDATFYEYVARDCYGSVFFDPYYKRYLRIFKRKVSEIKYTGKNDREKSVVIFNEDLQIIGESFLPKGFLVNTLFFTSDGRMYARANQKDTTALHFVRLTYKEKVSDSVSLAQIKSK